MDALQNQITAEQLKAVYRQLPTVVSALAGAGILVFMLRDVHSLNLLLSWFGVVSVSCLAAGMLYIYYIKNGQSEVLQPRWKIFFSIFTLCTGIIWGSIGILFYSAPVEYKLFIVVWIWAMGAGMSALLVAYRPAFYTMIIPLFIPLIISLLNDYDRFYNSIAIATFLWAISLMYFYHGNHRTLLQAISLRFINAELIKDLAKKNKEAENANLAKSKFLAAASHDLRQPLHAQSLFLAELDQYVDGPKARRTLGGLESSVYAMRKLLNAILDISQLDAGTLVPSGEVFSVAAVLKNLHTDFDALAAEKGIDLHIRQCKLVVDTDPVLLERILRNLIINAIRYTHKGRVLVGCRRHINSVSIQVLDTGIGIPADKQNDIFIPFMQLGNPERDREKGLGLGLSIVQGTAELLGFSLKLKSIPGKGTAISIDIPLSVQLPIKKNLSQPVTDIKNIRGKRVIIIDDDANVRTSMLGLLKSRGCLPLAFQNVHDALEYIKHDRKNIDLIVSDFNLSGSANGLQVIKQLRAQYGADIPAVIITGDTSVSRLHEAKASNQQILHKPVLANELLLLICRLVEVETA